MVYEAMPRDIYHWLCCNALGAAVILQVAESTSFKHFVDELRAQDPRLVASTMEKEDCWSGDILRLSRFDAASQLLRKNVFN